MYVLYSRGMVFSHLTENAERSSVSFAEGDEVTVEFDPLTRKLTFTKGADSCSVNTDISQTTTEPVNYCVRISKNSDISIK